MDEEEECTTSHQASVVRLPAFLSRLLSETFALTKLTSIIIQFNVLIKDCAAYKEDSNLALLSNPIITSE